MKEVSTGKTDTLDCLVKIFALAKILCERTE